MKRPVRTFSMLATLLLIALSAYFALRFLLGGTIVVDLSQEKLEVYQLFIDDELYGMYGYNEQTRHIRLPDRFGSYSLTIQAPGYEKQTLDAAVYFRGEKILVPDLQEQPIGPIADSFAKEEAGNSASAQNARIVVDENTGEIQLKFDIVTPDIQRPYSVYYDEQTGEWTEYGEGEN